MEQVWTILSTTFDFTNTVSSSSLSYRHILLDDIKWQRQKVPWSIIALTHMYVVFVLQLRKLCPAMKKKPSIKLSANIEKGPQNVHGAPVKRPGGQLRMTWCYRKGMYTRLTKFSWISHVSVSFIHQILQQYENVLEGKGAEICKDTLRIGARKVALVPTFLTFLALRQFWFDYNLPIFVTHLYYHDNMYHIKCVP